MESSIKVFGTNNKQTTQNNGQFVNGQSATVELTPQEQILEKTLDRYLSQMSVADKVGQLFVISFEGSEVTPASDIAELVYVYRVGGVTISPQMHNLTNDKNTSTPQNVAKLINQLQALSYGVFLPQDDALTLEQLPEYQAQGIPPSRLRALARSDNLGPLNIPLFVAVEQEGDNLPKTTLRQGFTELPSPLALGATWQPPLAEKVGRIAGEQLEAVGVNMLLGPNLDVVDQPLPDKVGSLGLFSFGGDPSWVSRMGRAYISGVHGGGNGRVLTIVGHFPGQGDSDRIPDLEVPTIQSSDQELRRVDFPPFIAVTRADSSILRDGGDLGATDGLMSSHARYASQQGVVAEGNPRPISLGTQLGMLLQEASFAPWRQRGLVMSNALGVLAIQKAFEPSPNGFPERRIALDAFNAGHDLLFLSQFGEPGNWDDQKKNITETIVFFRGRYETNAEFQASVDAAVRRILRAKLKLYMRDAPALETPAPETPPIEGTGAVSGTQTVSATNPITSSSDLDLSPASDITVSVDSSAISTLTSDLTPAFASPLVSSVLTDVLTGEVPVADEMITDTTSVTATQPITPEIPLPDVGLQEGVTAPITFTYPMTLAQAIPLSNVLTTEAKMDVFSAENIALANADIREVARASITLLSPEPSALTESLPGPPKANENILIFTNSRLQQECSSCTAEVAVAPDELADIMRNLYGVDATGQISDSLINSLAFSDLVQLLNGDQADNATPGANSTPSVEATPPAEEEIGAETEEFEEQPTETPADGAVSASASTPQINLDKNAKTELYIAEADWIIFAMLDINPTDPNSDVVKRFLGERGDQLSNKRVVVLALNAPYFLDATETSRLAAYIGVNSKIKPFLEQAVLTLFKANAPVGAPPISVPGTHFSNLNERLQPDPNQVLSLAVSVNDTVIAPPPEAQEAAPEVKLEVGGRILMQVGPIKDSNNNPVSDGTPVEFQVVYESEGVALVAHQANTRGGFAQREIPLEKSGIIRVSAMSQVGDNAQVAARSEEFTFNVSENPLLAAAATETAVAVQTPAENGQATQNGEQPANAAGNSEADANNGSAEAATATPYIHVKTLFLALLTIAVVQAFMFIVMARTVPRIQLMRSILWAIIIGLSAYILYFIYIIYGANIIPGAAWVQAETYPWGTVIIVFVAMLFPLLLLQLNHE